MDTFIIKVPEDKTSLVKCLLKELGVSVRKDTKAPTKDNVRLSDKYRNIFSEEDAKSFDRHTQNMRNEFIKSRKQDATVAIEAYNQELHEAEAEFERGEYLPHEQLLKSMKGW